MSDSPPDYAGDDWWRAKDGKWYPPNRHPDYVPPQDLPDPPASAVGRAEPPNGQASDDSPVPVVIPETNGMAIAALVMSVLGYVFWGFGTFFALVFGYRALGQLDEPDNSERGRGLAAAALILSWLQVALALLVVAAIVGMMALNGISNWQEQRELDAAQERARIAACTAQRELLTEAAEEFKRDGDKYPTSRDQVRSLIASEDFAIYSSQDYDYDDDGSGELTRLEGSECPPILED